MVEQGPFFHGTKADLQVGDLLTPGFPSNYRSEIVMNDPNVTYKKFPGNPTRSYRSSAPLKIVGEVKDWTRQTPEALLAWQERLAALRKHERGEIIN
jgi:rifampin ADP-ribosylating transferase